MSAVSIILIGIGFMLLLILMISCVIDLYFRMKLEYVSKLIYAAGKTISDTMQSFPNEDDGHEDTDK